MNRVLNVKKSCNPGPHFSMSLSCGPRWFYQCHWNVTYSSSSLFLQTSFPSRLLFLRAGTWWTWAASSPCATCWRWWTPRLSRWPWTAWRTSWGSASRRPSRRTTAPESILTAASSRRLMVLHTLDPRGPRIHCCALRMHRYRCFTEGVEYEYLHYVT